MGGDSGLSVFRVRVGLRLRQRLRLLGVRLGSGGAVRRGVEWHQRPVARHTTPRGLSLDYVTRNQVP